MRDKCQLFSQFQRCRPMARVDPATECQDTGLLCGQKASKLIIWQQFGD
jgi:hypothetical protein